MGFFYIEKEESDQSVESGKSKSSGEESKPKISIGRLPNKIALCNLSYFILFLFSLTYN